MENASKALIIAGAILLSILIIGLGMMIFNQAKDAMSNSGLDAQAIETYNNEFMDYVGNNIPAGKLKTLIGIVKNHNLAVIKDGGDTTKLASNEQDTRFIAVMDESTGLGTAIQPTQLDAMRGKLSNSGTYTVTPSYNNDGLISQINFKKN